MKNIFNTILVLSIVGTFSFGANTEVLTKAMVKLINKQKTLENAVFLLKQNQNKQDDKLSNKTYSNNEIKALNSQINEIQKELEFARNINDIKIKNNYKYKRNDKTILKIDNFISSNKSLK